MPRQQQKVYFASLGCPKNLVDTEAMMGSLASSGYTITTEAAEAELIVVNTCGFLQSAARESIDTLLELAEHKKTGRCQKLVMAGCLVERHPEELKRELPEVDVFLGTKQLALPDPDRPRLLATPAHTAYVKIAEGCNHACAFCIIPQLRGKQRSRSIDSIRREVEQLHAQGVKEFNLIAQDSTDYGLDRHDGTTIEKLLRTLAELPGEKWLRLMYAYPLSVTDELVDILGSYPTVARYIDVPFQHSSDRILNAMHRGSSGNTIRRLIDRLRARVPEITIRSTFIAGFPGETAAEFRELKKFLKDYALDHVGIFPFSVEPGTKAATLPGQLSEKLKQERRDALLAQQQGIAKRRNEATIGKTLKVLVEGKTARSEGHAPEIDGAIRLRGALPTGQFAQVRVIGASLYDLVAEPVKARRAA